MRQDKAFLEDYMNFGCMNHWVTANMFCQALHDPKAVPRQARQLNSTNTSRTVSDKQIHKILATKIIAEFVATLEDYSAFFLALNKREPIDGGIFYYYSKSQTSDATKFIESFLQTKSKSASKALGLPRLQKFKPYVQPEEYSNLREVYGTIMKNLRTIAKLYRPFQSNFEDNRKVRDRRNDINIITKYLPEERSQIDISEYISKLSIDKVYNKIKHRFLVADNFKNLYSSIKEEDTLLFIVLNSRKPWIDIYLQSIENMTKDIIATCNLLLFLDDISQKTN